MESSWVEMESSSRNYLPDSQEQIEMQKLRASLSNQLLFPPKLIFSVKHFD